MSRRMWVASRLSEAKRGASNPGIVSTAHTVKPGRDVESGREAAAWLLQLQHQVDNSTNHTHLGLAGVQQNAPLPASWLPALRGPGPQSCPPSSAPPTPT